MNNWIEDFLSNRSQRVRVGKDLSTEADLFNGIPQGMCLGRYCLQFLLMTDQNVSKAVAKSLLMIPKYMTWLAAVLRHKKTSIDYKNGVTCGTYTLI